MSVTVNALFMDALHQKYAGGFPEVGGMMHLVPITLLTHMKIYRFSTAGNPHDRLFGASWWFGFSAYRALVQLATLEARSLRAVARECLAVPPEWGNLMNLLVCADVRQPLSAWSGTPRTARTKDPHTHRYGGPWRPDRSITQLYVPGLSEFRLDGTRGPFIPWSDVLLPAALEHVG